MLYLKTILLIEIITGILSLNEDTDAKYTLTNACYIGIVIRFFNSNL